MPAPSAKLLLEMGRRGAGALQLPKPPQPQAPKLPIPSLPQAPTGPPVASDILAGAPARNETPAPTPQEVIQRLPERRPDAYSTTYDRLIETEAQRRGIDPALARAVAFWESGGNPDARGGAGEVGLFQVIPRDMAHVYSWAASRPSAAEMATPEAQVAAGLDVLENALKASGGNVQDALAIYNSGRPLGEAPDVTRQKYVPGVLSVYQGLAGNPPTSAVSAPQAEPVQQVLSRMSGYGGRGRVGEYAPWESIEQAPEPGPRVFGPGGVPDLPAYFGLRGATAGAAAPTEVPRLAAEGSPYPTRTGLAAPPVTLPEAKKPPEAKMMLGAIKAPPKPDEVLEAAAARGAPATVERAYERLGMERGLTWVAPKEWPEEVQTAWDAGYETGDAVAKAIFTETPPSLLAQPLRYGAATALAAMRGLSLATRPLLWVAEEVSQRIGAAQVITADPEQTQAIARAAELKAEGQRTGNPDLVRQGDETLEELRRQHGPTPVEWLSDLFSPDLERREEALEFPGKVIESFGRLVDATAGDWDTAMQAGDVGAFTPGLVQRAWVRIMAGEDPEDVGLDLIPQQEVVREMIGQTVTDPTTWLDLFFGNKALRAVQAWRAQRRLRPTAKSIAEVMAATAAESQPTGIRAIARRFNITAATTERRHLQIMDDLGDISQLVTSNAPDVRSKNRILGQWVASAGDDNALKAFAQKYNMPVVLSAPGKRSAGVLARLDEGNALTQALRKASAAAAEEGITGTQANRVLLQALFKRSADVLEEVAPPFKTVYEKMFDPLVKARAPLDARLAELFMGTNPAYAWRNLFNNLVTSFVDGHLPFESAAKRMKYVERFGAWPMSATRGIGPGQPTTQAANSLKELVGQIRSQPLKTGLFLGQYTERHSASGIVSTAMRRAMSSLWPRRVRQRVDELGELLGLTRSQRDALGWRLMDAVNENEVRDVVARFVGNDPDLIGKVVSAEVAEEVQHRIPGLADELDTILRESPDPDTASGRLTSAMQQERARILEDLEGPDAPIPKGSVEEALEQEFVAASGGRTSQDWMQEHWFPLRRAVSERETVMNRLAEAVQDQDQVLYRQLVQDEIIPAHAMRQSTYLEYFDKPANERMPWSQVTKRILDDHSARAERMVARIQQAGYDVTEWPVKWPKVVRRPGGQPPPAEPPTPTGPAPQAPPEPEVPPPVAPAFVGEPRAPVSQEALGELRAVGREAGIENDAHLLNAIRKELDLPKDRTLARLQDWSEDEIQRATDAMRQRAQRNAAEQAVIAVEAPRQVTDTFPIADINVDAARFQFKLGATEQGTTGALADVPKWEPNLASGVQLWRDPADGKVYVVNGHHRIALAKRMGVDELPGVYFIQADTAEAARAAGALKNISEGRGTPLDAAKFFRDSGITADDLVALGISMRENLVAQGSALANLNDLLFTSVVRGEFPTNWAVVIGQKLPDHNDQTSLLRLLERDRRNINEGVLSELIDLVQGAPSTVTTQATLFGVEAIQQSNAIEKAGVMAYVRQELSRDRRLFGTVAGQAGRLETAGNVIDVAQSRGVSREAAQLLDIWDRVKTQQGEISDILNDAARRIAGGESASKVQQEAYEQIREALPGVVRGAETPGTTGVPQATLFGAAEEPAAPPQRGPSPEVARAEPTGVPKATEVKPEDLAWARKQQDAGKLRVGDRYRDSGLRRTLKGIDSRGEEIWGYPYSPELFVPSDATGVPIRYYIELPNGARVHPDELHRLRQNAQGQWVVTPKETLTVSAPGQRNRRFQTTASALWEADSVSGPADTLVTLRSASGLELTYTKKQWTRIREVMRGVYGGDLKQAPSFAEVYDLLNEVDADDYDALFAKIYQAPSPQIGRAEDVTPSPSQQLSRAEQYQEGLNAGSVFEGGEVEPNSGYAWRSMGPKEFQDILDGKAFGTEAGGAKRGGYWSWYPGYSSRLTGTSRRPKYLVEVRGQWADETLVGRYTRDDITAVWKHEGQDWIRQELPPSQRGPSPQVGRAEGQQGLTGFLKSEEGSLELPFGRGSAPSASGVKAALRHADDYVKPSDVADEWDELVGRVTQDIRRNWGATQPGEFTPQQKEAMEAWTKSLLTDLNQTKAVAMNVGVQARDFTLLEYGHRRAFDTVLNTFLIYPYWASRTYPNWILRAAMHPGFLATYLRFKDAVTASNEDAPEWLQDQLRVSLPGFPEPLYLDIEAMFNPMLNLMETFDDPERRETPLGETLYLVDKMGFNPYPAFTWLYALERYVHERPEAAVAAIGDPSPLSRALKYATGLAGLGPPGGVTVPPWLWQDEPFFGGDKYAMRRVSRRLAEMQMAGEITETDAHAAARAMSVRDATNPAFRRAMEMEAEDRGPGVLVAYATALRPTPYGPADAEITEGFEEMADIYEGADDMTPEEWSAAWTDFYQRRPYMRTVSLARKDRDRADTSWAWDVLNRLPPGQSTDLLKNHGLSQEIIDKFYSITQDETDIEGVPRKQRAVAELEPGERLRFMGAILELSELYDVPTPAMTAEWQEAKDRVGRLYEIAETQFPGVQEMESYYYDLLATDPRAADDYAEANPVIWEYRDWVNDTKRSDPLLAWYYAPEPRKQAIDYIWDYWHDLRTSSQKNRLEQVFGPDFQDYFLKQKYDRIPDHLLLTWTHALGGTLVRSAETEAPGQQRTAPDQPIVTTPEMMAPTAEQVLAAIQH